MARPTQEEIDEFNARMNEPDEPDPDDFEVVLFNEQGSPVATMPYGRAKAYLARHGIELDDPADLGTGATGAPPASGGTGQAGRRGNAGNAGGNRGGNLPPAGVPGDPAPGTSRARTTSRYFGGKGQAQGGNAGYDPANGLPPA